MANGSQVFLRKNPFKVSESFVLLHPKKQNRFKIGKSKVLD